jgi:hypothetical protein
MEKKKIKIKINSEWKLNTNNKSSLQNLAYLNVHTNLYHFHQYMLYENPSIWLLYIHFIVSQRTFLRGLRKYLFKLRVAAERERERKFLILFCLCFNGAEKASERCDRMDRLKHDRHSKIKRVKNFFFPLFITNSTRKGKKFSFITIRCMCNHIIYVAELYIASCFPIT